MTRVAASICAAMLAYYGSRAVPSFSTSDYADMAALAFSGDYFAIGSARKQA